MTVTNWIRGDTLRADDLDGAFGNSVDKRGDTMTGLLTLAVDPTSPSDAVTKRYVDNVIANSGAVTYGWAPGNVWPPFENFNGTGHPGYHQSDRLIFQRAPTAATDFADIQINRSTAFSGGTVGSQLNAALRITTTIGSGDNTQEYGIISQTVNNGTGNGLGYAAFFISQKQIGASTFTVGANISARDFNITGASSTTGGGVVGLELSTGGSKADDAVNAQSFAGRGIRKGMHLVGIANASDTSQAEYSHAIWVGINDTNNSGSANANWDSIIGFSLSTQMRIGLDTRGAIAPTGSTDPVWAVTMTAGHGIDFNGSASLIANPGGRALIYNSGSSALQYLNAGTLELAVSDSGDVTASGFIQSTQYRIGGIQVVGARNTGWVAMTGAGNKNTVYDVSTVTLAQLASRVAIMQAVLTSHGLIGA